MSAAFRGPRYRGLVSICTILFAVLIHCGPAIADAGTVRLARGAESAFDAYTRAPSLVTQGFIRSKFWRMRTYSPYFDSRLSWYGDAWAYQDAYAIYPNTPEAGQHPDWILRDGSGNKLWIQFACGGGSCSQYAADIGNPAFRAWWIDGAKAKLAAGYKGLFIDDVNLAQRVSNGSGAYTLPVDPRTGRPMDETAWQHYMADFMAQIRAALPGVEIVHNAIWYMGDTGDMKRELDASDYTELERGFNDVGITGGTGRWGWESLMSFIDRRHAAGHHVILDGYADTGAGRLYGLATYFLVNDGGDALANDAQTSPDNFWSGYDVRLGPPVGQRYLSGGVWRRDFAGGTALAVEPGASAKTVSLGAGYHDLNGAAVASVTLPPASGTVLLRDGAAPAQPTAPGPTSTSVATTPTPTATPTPSSTSSPATASSPRSSRTRARASAARGRVRVHGNVKGATTGSVKITVQQRRGHRWSTATRAATKVSRAGAYSRALKRLPRGTYRVRANYLGTTTARPSRSAYRRFSLR